jgi:4'-phosphopantetheinyl transferase
VHVWHADLTVLDDELGELLSPGEHARAKALLSPRRRLLWRRARGVLRALLGRYLDVDPRSLRFAANDNGKPELVGFGMTGRVRPELGPAPATRLAFNLSHSGEVALYAVGEIGELGVDVELAGRRVDHLGLAERAFGAAEARRLRALGPIRREHEFLRSWTRHEAALKCTGMGPGGARTQGQLRPWIADLDIGPRRAAAVAIDRRPRELRTWNWAGEVSAHRSIPREEDVSPSFS